MEAGLLTVQLLGHVGAHSDGRRVEVTGSHRLATLSTLALRAGECVSSEELIACVWDEAAPDRARHALHVYVSELRRVLGADAVETRRGGYRLCVEHEQVDALLFEQMLRRVNGGPPEQTLAELREALSLWRGPALVGAAESSSLRAAAARLEEERLTAIERRIAAELELGHHDQVVGELKSLVLAMPLRESLCAQLMLALYRCGRQTEALASYRDIHLRLAELGLEPGSELRDLERAILRQDLSPAGTATRDGGSDQGRARSPDQTLEGLVAFAESWATDLRNFDPDALAAITGRADELAWAFEHAIHHAAKEAGVRLIAATWCYWVIRGASQEADRWARAILALPAELTPLWEMEGQVGASELARAIGDYRRAVDLKTQAREIAEREGESRLVAGLDADLAHLWIRLGRLDLAEAHAHRALELRRSDPNDPCGVGHALVAVGELHEVRGELLEAVKAYEDAIADAENNGFGGEAAYIRGHLLGRALRASGRSRAAYSAYRRALDEARPVGDHGTVATALQGLAWVAAVQGDQPGAVRLLAEASGPESQNALDPEEQTSFADDLAALRRDVPREMFDAAWQIGAARGNAQR